MSGHKLLLVEDSEEGQLIVQTSLADSGIEVVPALTFSDAKRKIDTAQTGEFSIVMLDLILPDGDGMNLFSLILQNPAFYGTPVVMLTGKDDIFNKIEAFESGIEEYLVKPINPIELRSRIDQILRKRKKP